MVVSAQHSDFYRDAVWPRAYDPQYDWIDSPYVKLDFSSGQLVVRSDSTGIPLFQTGAAVSDSTGKLLFYSNGLSIAKADGSIVLNGDSLCDNPDHYEEVVVGLNLNQGAVLLPQGNDGQKYRMFHVETFPKITYPYDFVYYLYSSLIVYDNDMDDWVVIEKSDHIIIDTLDWGLLSACRHANGRDWWVIAPKMKSGIIYTVLLIENGQMVIDTVQIPFVDWGNGQSSFTPDGNSYLRLQIGNEYWLTKIHRYNFDRASGQFSYLETYLFPYEYAFYASVSPNSRYYYVSTADKLYQYDLWAEDFLASEILVAVYDGFISPWFATIFGQMQIAPDGRIYMGTGNGTDKLHVIDRPDEQGLACNVLQHSISIPSYSGCLPYFPNFRLGPIDGSPADTLGIDNIPVAGWRNDTLHSLNVVFTDNSYYNVTTWHWSFGDGQTDTVEHPLHQYSAPGIYWVCQVVSNENAADTLCKWVQVGMGSDTIVYNTVGEYGLQVGLRVYPNPTSDFIFVQGDQAIEAGHTFVLTDALGREWAQAPLAALISSIDLRGLPSGVYFYRIVAPNGLVRQAGKVVKM